MTDWPSSYFGLLDLSSSQLLRILNLWLLVSSDAENQPSLGSGCLATTTLVGRHCSPPGNIRSDGLGWALCQAWTKTGCVSNTENPLDR